MHVLITAGKVYVRGIIAIASPLKRLIIRAFCFIPDIPSAPSSIIAYFHNPHKIKPIPIPISKKSQ